MKLRILFFCILIFPAIGSAEIYKWKDSNGVVRYSDVPPPSNIKQESMYGKKTAKSKGSEPLTAVDDDATEVANKYKATTVKEKDLVEKAVLDKSNVDRKTKADKSPLSKEAAASKRAKDAEQEKKVDEQKQAELKIKEENCKSAKSNLATFTNGGRITKTDENGEKLYLGDADIKAGLNDAKRDVEKYCE